MTALAANLALCVADVLLVRYERPWWGLWVLPPVAVAAGLPFRESGSWIFAAMQCVAWALFLHWPVLLLLARRWGPGLAVAAVGLWAFGIEPRWLEVRRETLPGPGIRVALITDLQTDHVDAHTRGALAAVARAEPDLVVFAGDYVQVRENDAFVREAASMNEALRQLHPPLGAVAVRGDVDADAWSTIFAGLPVRVVETSETLDLGALVLTALDPRDSRSPGTAIPAVDRFHLVVGHAPDYALHTGEGDLLLAGHTHGGQVRVPGFGPLLTFSEVPRAWAGGGLVELGGGRHLYVSRGVGLERLDAPRLRLFCRPEVTLFDLGDRGGAARVRPVPLRRGSGAEEAEVPGQVLTACERELGAGARLVVEDAAAVRIGDEERRAGVGSCCPGGECAASPTAAGRQYAWITHRDGAADFAGEVGRRGGTRSEWWTDPAVEATDLDGDGSVELQLSGRWELVDEGGTIDADLARLFVYPRARSTEAPPCPWVRLLPERLPHLLYVVEDGRVRDEASGTEGRLQMSVRQEGGRLQVWERWEAEGGWGRSHERVVAWDAAHWRLDERCPTRAPPLAHAR